VNAVIDVPSGGPWFEGHFPGRPILPGVAQIALVVDALARDSGHAPSLRGIAFARLRQLVLPGDRLELLTRESAPDRLRFDLKRDGVAVANGELITGVPQVQDNAPPAGNAAPTLADPAPTLDELLPHRPPMRFLSAVLRETAQGLVGRARIPAGCALAHHGIASPVAAIEAAAQAAAAWEALRRRREAGRGGPRIGYLVSMRDIVFFSDRIPADQDLQVSVALDAVALPLTHYRIEVMLDARLLTRGMIATFLTEEAA
jgi:3-hydroxyacyl-[acyl-carrier-protein] dehydratase